MSYRIELPERLANTIKSYLPAKCLPGLIEELDRLGFDPSLGGPEKIGSLRDRMVFRFEVVAKPLHFRFAAAYRFDQDEQRIWIDELVDESAGGVSMS